MNQDLKIYEKWMRHALIEAIKGFDEGEIPVGAVVVKDNRIIGKGYNQVESLNDSKTLITTEKDAVKLCEFKDIFSDYSVYYVPIEIEFLHNRELSKYI